LSFFWQRSFKSTSASQYAQSNTQLHDQKTAKITDDYLFSKKHTAQAAATLIREYWQIENSLHWSLDVVMNDDKHRARKGNAPVNFATLRRIALNIIKANPAKGSNCGKFKKAGWNNDFLKTLIQGF
jgi:predicted transposase YbfD/YdcC